MLLNPDVARPFNQVGQIRQIMPNTLPLRIFKPSTGPETRPDQGQNGQKEVLPKGVGLTCDWDSKWGVNSPQEHHTDHGTYRVCARVHSAFEVLVTYTSHRFYLDLNDQ